MNEHKQAIIPKSINDFLLQEDCGFAEVSELDVYTLLVDKKTGKNIISAAIVLDKDEVVLQWERSAEEGHFKVYLNGKIYKLSHDYDLMDT